MRWVAVPRRVRRSPRTSNRSAKSLLYWIDSAVVVQRQPLMERIAPGEDRPRDVQKVLLQHDAAVDEEVRIGEVDREQRVVVAQVRTQQQGRQAVHQQFEV
jgi:hypothetical protein